MKTLTDPKEFYEIQSSLGSHQFREALASRNNIKMRALISSYGFKARREDAEAIFNLDRND